MGGVQAKAPPFWKPPILKEDVAQGVGGYTRQVLGLVAQEHYEYMQGCCESLGLKFMDDGMLNCTGLPWECALPRPSGPRTFKGVPVGLLAST